MTLDPMIKEQILKKIDKLCEEKNLSLCELGKLLVFFDGNDLSMVQFLPFAHPAPAGGDLRKIRRDAKRIFCLQRKREEIFPDR